ncbi:Lsr2 family protein [Umezawaea endophytica]|uniref:Lsr2 family protein n=2 Tax=Umezawaea endophytica TaxID=1654476 RepID=A0A9X2VJ77_9PSEU|nr:Lsr2 family protein [Umezawaea endophytica]
MARLARHWQIIVLSHHDHIRQVAERLGVDNLTVSTLSPPTRPRSLRSPNEIRDAVRESSVLDNRPPTHSAHSARATRTSDPTEIRAWARENGMQVADRGRIPGDVTDAYEAAHR